MDYLEKNMDASYFISFSTVAHTPSQWPLTITLFIWFTSALPITS